MDAVRYDVRITGSRAVWGGRLTKERLKERIMEALDDLGIDSLEVEIKVKETRNAGESEESF